MRVFRVFSLLLVVFLLVGVVTAQAPPKPGTAPVGVLVEVMRGIMYDNSNKIFDVQKGAPKDDGTVYTGWTSIESSAMVIAEAAQNLLTVPGRKCSNGQAVPVDQADFQKFAVGLKVAALKTYQAAKSKNQDEVSKSTDELTDACDNCHSVYRDVPGGVPNRCKLPAKK